MTYENPVDAFAALMKHRRGCRRTRFKKVIASLEERLRRRRAALSAPYFLIWLAEVIRRGRLEMKKAAMRVAAGRHRTRRYAEEQKTLEQRRIRREARIAEKERRRLERLQRPRLSEEEKAARKKAAKKRDKQRVQTKLRHGLSERIRQAIKSAHGKKTQKTTDLLGCSIAKAREHLEALFKPGMTWENMGKWHIDHIRPCASFDLTDPAQQRQCFHYTNLQPLWGPDNLRKSAKWAPG